MFKVYIESAYGVKHEIEEFAKVNRLVINSGRNSARFVIKLLCYL